jgi:hypothetical protein
LSGMKLLHAPSASAAARTAPVFRKILVIGSTGELYTTASRGKKPIGVVPSRGATLTPSCDPLRPKPQAVHLSSYSTTGRAPLSSGNACNPQCSQQATCDDESTTLLVARPEPKHPASRRTIGGIGWKLNWSKPAAIRVEIRSCPNARHGSYISGRFCQTALHRPKRLDGGKHLRVGGKPN